MQREAMSLSLSIYIYHICMLSNIHSFRALCVSLCLCVHVCSYRSQWSQCSSGHVSRSSPSHNTRGHSHPNPGKNSDRISLTPHTTSTEGREGEGTREETSHVYLYIHTHTYMEYIVTYIFTYILYINFNGV